MKVSIRRTCVVLSGLALLTALAFLAPVNGQQQPIVQLQLKGGIKPTGAVNPDAPKGSDEFGAVQLPTDSKLSKKVEAARDYIKEEAWGEACRILQSLLDVAEDKFVPDPDSKDANPPLISVRIVANRLLSTMPDQGLEHYRLSYGTLAKDQLNQAKADGDAALLAQVAQRFLHTEAGAEATNLIGSRLLDRGDSVNAALWFERLRDRDGLEKLSPPTLLKAALAFHRVGDQENKERAWKQLSAKAGSSLRLGDRTIDLADLRAELDRLKNTLGQTGQNDVVMFRGDPTRSGQGNGGIPFLEKQWAYSTVKEEGIRNLLTTASRVLESRGQPVLPTAFPVATDGKLIYRTHKGIHARSVKTGQELWYADSRLSLDYTSGTPGENAKFNLLNTWAQQYIGQGKAALVLENSTVGTLSTDGNLVYAIEDLPLPPVPQQYEGMMPNGQRQNFGPLNEAAFSNKLVAYDLKTNGKLRWELGGKAEKKEGDKKDEADLSETFFLGAPLPLHGKVYVLTEKQQELRLVCIDPAKENGAVVWTQTLASTQNKLAGDVNRRVQAAHLAYGEGILVCPTNAGAVLGVELLTHSLVWAYGYREKGEMDPNQEAMIRQGMIPPPPGWNPNNKPNRTEWKVTAPVIADGKVVFTAPDGGGIHCVSLRDGKRLWKMNREDDDLYLAGAFKDKVLIVGKNNVRALGLADGKAIWREDTGLPSGQGVAAEGVYYLPLKSATKADGKGPAVCAIDIDKGTSHCAKARKKADGTQVVPGNLLFHEGGVISQTLDEVAAFPQLKVKRQQKDEMLAKNPNDPVGLTERAELQLDEGNRQGAVDDLHLALKNDPPPATVQRARAKMYEALTEYLQDNFDKAEKYLDEYRDLCKVEIGSDANAEERTRLEKEKQKRQATYLCLLARGREHQGKLIEAFDAYTEYGGLGAGSSELMDQPLEPAVKSPPDVWAQGQIGAMVAKAGPEQRKPLEDRIAQRWGEVKDTTDMPALRKFVAMFGAQFRVGREARLALAERLMEEPSKDSLLEAERHLLMLRLQPDEPQLSGQAVEALARLMARKGLLEDAAHYYRVLGREFPKVVVRDGKTGEDFFNELATDKRFLPYLDEPGGSWTGAKVKVKDEYGNFQPNKQVFTFEPAGEVVPFFQRHKVALELNFHQLKVIDVRSGEERWSQNLTRTQFQNFLYNYGNPNQPPRFAYYTVGHTFVLNLGQLVFGLDPVNKKVLWEKNLLGSQGNTPANIVQDPKDGSLQIYYQDGWMQRLGQMGPVEPSYVCLLTRDGLLALDPATGRTLWSRSASDVSTRCHLFGDDQHVYLVEMNQQGAPTSTRALRAYDGVSVPVPDFTAVYQQKQRTIGRMLLVADNSGANGGLALRLYDVHTGKDTWMKEYPANSTVLRCDDPNLVGAIEPGGKVVAFDLRTQKEVFKAEVDPKHLEKAQGVTLLSDRSLYYLAINGPGDQNNNPGGTQSNFLPTTGTRCVPVNGNVYAFDRDNWKLKWRVEVPQQMLVMENFNDLPMLVFTSRYNKLLGNGPQRWWVNGAAIKVIDKRTGKLLDDKPELNNNNGQQFHAYNVDLKAGKVEMVSYNYKVTYFLEGSSALAEAGPGGGKDKPATQPTPPPGGGLRPGGRLPVPQIER